MILSRLNRRSKLKMGFETCPGKVQSMVEVDFLIKKIRNIIASKPCHPLTNVVNNLCSERFIRPQGKL